MKKQHAILDGLLAEVHSLYPDWELQTQNVRTNVKGLPNLLRGTMARVDAVGANVGGSMSQFSGEFRVDVFVPSGTGYELANEVMDAILEKYGVTKTHSSADASLNVDRARIETARTVQNYLNLAVYFRWYSFN